MREYKRLIASDPMFAAFHEQLRHGMNEIDMLYTLVVTLGLAREKRFKEDLARAMRETPPVLIVEVEKFPK